MARILSLRYFIFIALVLVVCWLDPSHGAMTSEGDHHRVRRGNFGQRYSGGLGSQGAANGGGYHQQKSGPNIIFDHIALNTISGPNDRFIESYQARQNAQASMAWAYDQAQQQGQHDAAHAGLAANQAGAWYNAIATGPVSPVYKGEYRRRR